MLAVPEWDPIAWDDFAALVPPRDLWPGPHDPAVHFMRWIWEYQAYLTLLCGMRRDDSVLELGCNHGRTMLGLVDYLRPPGRYEGLDILPRQIEFAQQAIQSRFPWFRFTLADVHNSAYNPEGTVSADQYRFPYPDAHFDVAYAASLFTHLLPPAATRYLIESRRVLRPGGRGLYSFFVLDHYGGKGSAAHQLYEFEHAVPGSDGVAVHDPSIPEQVVAYSRAQIEHMARQAGLQVERVLPGTWSKTAAWSVNEQDLVLLRRPSKWSMRRVVQRVGNAGDSALRSRVRARRWPWRSTSRRRSGLAACPCRRYARS